MSHARQGLILRKLVTEFIADRMVTADDFGVRNSWTLSESTVNFLRSLCEAVEWEAAPHEDEEVIVP